MCEFPSWIQTRKDEVLFLIDKDIRRGENVYDKIGHRAIENFFGKKFPHNQHREGFPCHPKIAKAIRNGQMKKMARAGEYTTLCVDTKGRLHGVIRRWNFWGYLITNKYKHGKQVG